MRKKRKTLDKKSEKLEGKNTFMKQKLQEHGITLIALVVTIIILLILTGVTLNIALSDNGLFNKAKEAVEKYKKVEDDEENALNRLAEQLENMNIDYNDYIGCYITNYNAEKKTYNIEKTKSGADSDQVFSTEDMQWQIWDYDGKVIRLISNKPTNTELKLKGSTGYNNGVLIVNKICEECYTMKGIEGINVVNLKRSDIQNVSNYDYTKYKHDGNEYEELITGGEHIIHYGDSKNYTANNNAPQMWIDNDSTWTYEYDENIEQTNRKNAGGEVPWEEGFNMYNNEKGEKEESISFKQSYYAHNYKINQNEFKDNRYYNLIFENGKDNLTGVYWLAGRYVHLGLYNCSFGMNRVEASSNGCYVRGGDLYDSVGNDLPSSYAIRPIVSINLEQSGYRLRKVQDSETNEVKFELIKNS